MRAQGVTKESTKVAEAQAEAFRQAAVMEEKVRKTPNDADRSIAQLLCGRCI